MRRLIYLYSNQAASGRRRETRDPGRPPRTFQEYFSGPELWSTPALWLAYQEWLAMNARETYAGFKESLDKKRDLARERMDAWPLTLENGKKGQPYSATFHLPGFVKDYKINGLEKTGLVATKDKLDRNICNITGVPDVAGDFDLQIMYTWVGRVKGMAPLIRNCRITINPDPRELWKNTPTPFDLEYYKTDLDSNELDCAGGRLLGASRRGRSHAHVGLPRDDDFGLGCVNGWSILVVADGAGSAQFSREGSRIACQTALKICQKKLSSNTELDNILNTASKADTAWLGTARKLAYGILPDAAFQASRNIREEAQLREREAKNYATTLLLAMAKKYRHGWIVMSFQIGDGAMAMFSRDGRDCAVELLAEPDEGEYGGQTRFITMKDLYESQELMRRLRVDLVEDLEVLLLMTDGISDARFATLANLRNPGIWRELWLELRGLANGDSPQKRLLEWLNFWSVGNHDDRTIAIFFRD